jgi:hypothetical protein
MYQHAVCIALPDRAQAAATLRRGRELHLARILYRQNVPSRAGRVGSVSPARNQLCDRHFGVGNEPTSPQLAAAAAAQTTQAQRLAHDHLFEDGAPLLSRRTSPNDPSDNSMAAPVGRLPQDSESYRRRVGQAVNAKTLRIKHYLCACPSAEEGIDWQGAEETRQGRQEMVVQREHD